VLEISVEELKRKLGGGEPVHLLDVREADEVAICALPGAQHLPMLALFAGVAAPDAPPDAEIVVYCHHGLRSLDAVRFLRMRGFAKARSLAGGIDAWAARVDPTMRRY
jgi:rhodanese-related sulfurtransferase